MNPRIPLIAPISNQCLDEAPESLTLIQQEAVLGTLSNDENSTDEELVEYFMSELELSQVSANYWVSRRMDVLNEILVRSEERSVGTEWVSTSGSGWSTCH